MSPDEPLRHNNRESARSCVINLDEPNQVGALALAAMLSRTNPPSSKPSTPPQSYSLSLSHSVSLSPFLPPTVPAGAHCKKCPSWQFRLVSSETVESFGAQRKLKFFPVTSHLSTGFHKRRQNLLRTDGSIWKDNKISLICAEDNAFLHHACMLSSDFYYTIVCCCRYFLQRTVSRALTVSLAWILNDGRFAYKNNIPPPRGVSVLPRPADRTEIIS